LSTKLICYENSESIPFIFHFYFLCSELYGTASAALDSMKSSFVKAKTAEEKVFWLDILSGTAMNVNPGQAEEYGKQLIT
jgi:hypothetical protein